MRRLFLAVLVLLATVVIVYADRGGHHDNANGSVPLLDALYYATVTLSTTGYGDIVPYMHGRAADGSALDLIERPIEPSEVGLAARDLRDLVVSVKRGDRLLDDDPAASPLLTGDRVIAIHRAGPSTAPLI